MTRTVQVIHCLTSGDLVVSRSADVDGDYLAVPAACPDCRHRAPLAVPPAAGCDAAIMYVHDPSCPRVPSAGRRSAS